MTVQVPLSLDLQNPSLSCIQKGKEYFVGHDDKVEDVSLLNERGKEVSSRLLNNETTYLAQALTQ